MPRSMVGLLAAVAAGEADMTRIRITAALAVAAVLVGALAGCGNPPRQGCPHLRYCR